MSDAEGKTGAFQVVVWRISLKGICYITVSSIPDVNLSRYLKLTIRHYESRGKTVPFVTQEIKLCLGKWQ